MVVAVTGGIGSGKSFVCKELAAFLSAFIISADEICRELLAVNGEGWKRIRTIFGDTLFLNDGQIDRILLRKRLFSNDQFRREVDDILHPMVREKIIKEAAVARENRAFVLVEVPLLFEKGWQKDFDLTVLVYADPETCMERIVSRDSVSISDARQSISKQMKINEKIKLADYVVYNDKSSFETKIQLKQLAEELQKKSF